MAVLMFLGDALLLGRTRRGKDAVLLLWVLCMHFQLSTGALVAWIVDLTMELCRNLLVEAASVCKATSVLNRKNRLPGNKV